MPLVKATLKVDIKTILTELKDATDQEAAIEKYATDMSDAIDTYIRSATVVVTGTTGTIQ